MSICEFFVSQDAESVRGMQEGVRSTLESKVDSSKWGVDIDFNPYASKDSIWNHEARKAIKRKLEAGDIGLDEYSEWLGDIQFISASFYIKSFFGEYKSNAGWRVNVIGIPAVGVVLVGLSSHYQNGQNHNKLGEASNFLYDVINVSCEEKKRVPALLGRKVGSRDWDQDGLFHSPIDHVKGVYLSPETLFLKEVRNTTLKKTLASFIAIDVLPGSCSDEDFFSSVLKYISLGEFVYESTFPFGNLEEFESFRSLAIQDIDAAYSRFLLKSKSGGTSIVRVYYGPPGTGKTLAAVERAVKIVNPAFNGSDYEESFEEFNSNEERCAFVTFHPSLQYEDLVESIRPDLSNDALEEVAESEGDNPLPFLPDPGPLSYKVHEGVFLKMIRRALKNPSNEYVIVIDEINRGDLSRILGPLISSLEPDKRAGSEYPIGIELMYPESSEVDSRLFMPSNLHFIGTMNSSDRNIALVDHALRRRFEFVELLPQPSLLTSTEDTDSIDCNSLLDAMNSRIEHLIDSDHVIGHGYLMGCKANAQVVEVMARKIIPLLREYFYGNEGMILLVLGDHPGSEFNFFEKISAVDDFSSIFNVDVSYATEVGYRGGNAYRNIRLDKRFWDDSELVSGPHDLEYATQCLLKVYN